MPVEKTSLASMIEQSVLRADATATDVSAACELALSYRFHAVCVNPYRVRLAAACLDGSGVNVVAVIAFPLGALTVAEKVREAVQCVSAGADEIDVVMNLGAFLEGEHRIIEDEIHQLRGAAEYREFKLIIESGMLSIEQAKVASRLGAEAGVTHIKTSTGFNSCPGATPGSVRAIRSVLPSNIGVKASGGIRNAASALALVAAGATRIGTSAGKGIIDELSEDVP